jgi:hypothetical protein
VAVLAVDSRVRVRGRSSKPPFRRASGPALRVVVRVAKGSSPLSETGASVYPNFIEGQLTEERSRKESLERRGMWVVTASGASLALLPGLLRDLPRGWPGVVARMLAVCSLASLAWAGYRGILVNWLRGYDEPKIEELETFVAEESWEGHWEQPSSEAILRMSRTNLETLKAARTFNNGKASNLRLAMLGQGIGFLIAGLAGAVILVSR